MSDKCCAVNGASSQPGGGSQLSKLANANYRTMAVGQTVEKWTLNALARYHHFDAKLHS
jgi:hypothetical protein